MSAETRIVELEKIIDGLANTAKKDSEKARRALSLRLTLIICLCVVFCIACICGTILGIYAVDRNYDYLESLVIETTTETFEVEADSEGDGNAIAIHGNDNQAAGGDINGEGKN